MIKGKILVAFCKHSWKPFCTEEEAMDFIIEQEIKHGEYWSISTGTVEFSYPAQEKPIEFELQDIKTINTADKLSKKIYNARINHV